MRAVHRRNFRDTGPGAVQASFTLESYLAMLRAVEYVERPTAALYERLEVPALFAFATGWEFRRRYREIERVAARRGFRVEWLPGHHLIHQQVPELLANAIGAFVQDVYSTPPRVT